MQDSDVTEAMTCWVISDGRRGIENQALGLAEALARLTPLNIERFQLSNTGIFKALPPLWQTQLKRKEQAYGLPTSCPDLMIGCGRQAIAPLILLKKKYGAAIFTAYIQDPRISIKNFDCVIAPNHDALTGPNIETMIGSPNRLTEDRFKHAKEQFKFELAGIPPKRVAVLIGGNSKAYDLDADTARRHIDVIQNLAKLGYGILLSVSRRTPKPIIHLYKQALSSIDNIWIYDGDGENPYFAFLATAEFILVTEDSTNMLTEACATGKPVYALPLRKKNNQTARKFEHLRAELSDRCGLKRIETLSDLEKALETPHIYAPLDETGRIAKRLLHKLKPI